jgi:hypothetical protein
VTFGIDFGNIRTIQQHLAVKQLKNENVNNKPQNNIKNKKY